MTRPLIKVAGEQGSRGAGKQRSRGAGEQGGQGGIIEQVSPLSSPSTLSLLHAQCPSGVLSCESHLFTRNSELGTG
ncbi:hypothetical protein [Nostoc sp. DedQUE09]|uniref:hypothetical protein n=1 Tax=Nostoc sp. DedQUE09 TaxID=3075394 RepID=UPI002AD4D206|nr:hypothetical protein [Nostoc sp. DedQUE09]MDZ7951619.1 hypothetical protein [Nostoc sp. DedQUE09]